MDKKYIEAFKKESGNIINEWVSLVKKSKDRHQKNRVSGIEETVTEHFNALIDIFEKEDNTKLNIFLEKLAKKRDKPGFSLKETQLAFLYGQTVFMRFMDRLRDDDQFFCINCREISDIFNENQILHSNHFRDLQLENITNSYSKELEYEDLRLASLSDGTTDAVIILDEKLNISTWNEGAELMFQYKPNEVIGKSLDILFTDELRTSKELRSMELLLKQDGLADYYRTERVRKDGKVLTVEVNWTRLRNNDGKLIGYSTIHNDLTEKIQIRQEIFSKEHYLSSVVDNSVDAIIGMDLNDTIVSWNKGAENIFGYPREEVIGKNFDILLTPEAKKSGELRLINTLLKQEGFIKNYEGERVTKDGKRITTSLTRSIIRDKNRKIIGSSAILRDMTEYKKLKTQISHSEKLSVVGQLAAGIAHEVGNPLTSISSLIQVLVRGTDDENLKKNLNLIKKQTDRISKLIHELVTFSQPSDF
ncbi:PAS domain S-box protein [candidate division KSB1 bacterium]|nr:PAS domain S-box protein [candidate division KSB1 bacterium]